MVATDVTLNVTYEKLQESLSYPSRFLNLPEFMATMVLWRFV